MTWDPLGTIGNARRIGGTGRTVVLVPPEVNGSRDANGVADLVAGPLGLA